MAKPGPSPRVTLEDVLEEFRSREDPYEPLTAPEIADALSCSRTTALNKLRELADQGTVVSKKVGSRSRVWWIPSSDSEERDLLKGYGSWTGTDLSAAVEKTHEQLDEDLREDERVLS